MSKTSSDTDLLGETDSNDRGFCAGDGEEEEAVKNLMMDPLSGENLAGVL